MFLCFRGTKKLQTSAMKACFQIAECSIFSAKIMNSEETARLIP